MKKCVYQVILYFLFGALVSGCSRQLPDAGGFLAPSIGEISAREVTESGAVLVAEVQNPASVAEQGFRIRKEGSSISLDVKAELKGEIFTAVLSDLDDGSLYVFDAYVGNGKDRIIRSPESTFSTLKASTPPAQDPSGQDQPGDEPQTPELPEYVNIPDDTFRAWILWNYDSDNDGNLSAKEALGVSKIELSTEKIYSFEGIQYFPNLSYLSAPAPRENDVNMGNLTRLDLSANPKLTHIYLTNNKISDLKLGDHKNLDYLGIDYNEVAELDVSEYKRMTLLQVSYNKLRYIDVRGLDELSEFQCDYNPLDTIRLSNAKLESFRCEGTNIKELDLSGCPKINNVVCTSCPNLEKIILAKGQVIGSLRRDEKAKIVYNE